MNSKDSAGDKIGANVSGDISGQVAVGKRVSQIQQSGSSKPSEITPEELIRLKNAFESLRAKVSSEAALSHQRSAIERINELEEAITAEKTDFTTIEYVKRWFMKHLPAFSGAVTSVIIHPIVGKLVEASGDMVAEEFRQRFQR